MRRNKSGLSILELLVAAVITITLAGGIFSLVTSARNTVGLSRAKEDVKQMVELALKHLQTDISVSQADIDKNDLDANGKPKALPSFQADGANSWKMDVPKTENAASMADDYLEVTYTLDGNKLYRDGGIENKKKLIASKISKLEMSFVSDEQVLIEIEAQTIPEGQQIPVKHNQKVLVTIREAVAAEVDDRWRTSEEALTNY
jgi:type II secretory pathway pseudopilin PulG